MAVKSNLTTMAVCLTVVCLVCSALLGGMYAVTAEPIEKANADILKASIGTVDGAPVAYAVRSTTVGFGGPLVLMVGITADGVVYNTSVLSHNETPGLGAKCNTDEKFMNQFKGFDPSSKSLTVKKDGGDVDAITASTITSRAYSQAVDNAVKAFNSIKGE